MYGTKQLHHKLIIFFFFAFFLVLTGYEHSVKISSNSKMGPGQRFWFFQRTGVTCKCRNWYIPGQSTGQAMVSVASPGQSTPPLGNGVSHSRRRVVTEKESEHTVKFLNFGTPEIFAVIYLIFKQRRQT